MRRLIARLKWWMVRRLVPSGVVLVDQDDINDIHEQLTALVLYVYRSGAMTHPKRIRAYSRLTCGITDVQFDITRMEEHYA